MRRELLRLLSRRVHAHLIIQKPVENGIKEIVLEMRLV